MGGAIGTSDIQFYINLRRYIFLEVLLFRTVFYFSELCFTFPTDFTKGRCPLDPRRGDHSNVVITPRPTLSKTQSNGVMVHYCVYRSPHS